MTPPAPKRRAGGRRPKEEELEYRLPPEEEEKRRLRRLRNKEAAARCRKRRLDQMTTFEIKVEELQSHQNSLETELDRLLQEKNDLEFILRAHEPLCQRGDIKTVVSISPAILKIEADEIEADDVMMDEKSANNDPTLTSAAVLHKLKRSMDSDFLARPNTLQFASRSALASIGTLPSFENETPSKELFHLLNQPTGLTPTTSGGLTPFLAYITSTGSSMVPSLDTPSIGESKILPKSLTKL